MRHFDYSDNKVMHILATYISDGYMFPDVIKRDNNYRFISLKTMHKYNFVWDSKHNRVRKKLFSNTIYVPRHIDKTIMNSKLESILYFGANIFKIISEHENIKQNVFKHIFNKINAHLSELIVDRRLERFFDFLQQANKELIKAYNEFPNNPMNLKDIDRVFINYQSHIFLVTTLFELYHPFEQR